MKPKKTKKRVWTEAEKIVNERKRRGRMNRATPAGYLKYMLANPVYFTLLAELEATEKNILAFFTSLKGDGLVAHPYATEKWEKKEQEQTEENSWN